MIKTLRKAAVAIMIIAALKFGAVGCGDAGSTNSGSTDTKPKVESVEVHSDTNLETIAYDSHQATATFNVYDSNGDVVSGEYRVNGGAWQPMSGPVNGPYTGTFTVTGNMYTLEGRVSDNDSEDSDTYLSNPDIAAKETKGKSIIKSKIDGWVNSGAVMDGGYDAEVTHTDGSKDRVDGWIIDWNGIFRAIEYQGEYQTTQTLDNMKTRFANDGSKMDAVYSIPESDLGTYVNSLDPNTMGD